MKSNIRRGEGWGVVLSLVEVAYVAVELGIFATEAKVESSMVVEGVVMGLLGRVLVRPSSPTQTEHQPRLQKSSCLV